jgi:hypothetical protein
MLENDENFGFLFSYIANEDVFLKVGRERIVRECDLPSCEIRKFRKKVGPWIEAGMIVKTSGRNPFLSLEEEPNYYLTLDGERCYQSRMAFYSQPAKIATPTTNNKIPETK